MVATASAVQPWRAYLRKLDRRLRIGHDVKMDWYMARDYDYKNARLRQCELEKVVRIAQEQGLVLMPATLCHGFKPGFYIYSPTDPVKKRVLLEFTEKQLPRNYGFRHLLQVCRAKENAERARECNLEEIGRSRSDYDY